ncbi:MAG TPA: chromosome segregation protein SMC, partial [Candidatus Obscuribacterales bacterium]
MRIKEIELDNFKSFGKRTVIPLLDGFTTISGPNGSGKSNIIDSLLFALGLSSTRSMRAERLPDLLNNLSGKNEARVTVRFTNDDGIEIEVSRRIRVKDNGYTSTYYLNGKSATLTEVHEELMKYNVSPAGFNVIMQGDVTGIVSMSPTERRRIIDELAGVAEFDRRIEQANEELTSVAERIEHQKIVLSEIESRLEVLRADRDQALKYLELKTQKERIERDLIFVRVKEVEERAQAELRELEKLAKREESLIESMEKAEIELLTLRAELGRIEQDIREKGGNEQLLLKQELDNLRGDLTREENKLSNLNGVAGEKAKLHKSISAQVKTIDKHLNELARQKKQSEEDLQAVQLVLMEKQGALSAVLAEIEVLRQEKDRSSDRVTSLHDDLQKLRDRKHGLEVRKTELATRKEGLERELESIRNSATTAIGRSASLKGLVQNLERKFSDDQALVLGIERTIRQLEGEIESTREEIEDKRQELESLNRKLIEAETTREVAGESGYGRAAEAVLAAGIPGVHGTIGQLGQVDERYSLALEMAIGPRLGHIVVEDDVVAQQCIEFLKEKQAGRATFVPLNKINAQPPGLLPNRPGVIDFAYNLIDFNPKYTKAFQYACGQTIVVEDMEVARRLINQARMVTLEGELFEKTGTITGGHDLKARMRFSSKGDSDINALRSKSKALADDIRWLQESLKELTVSLNQERDKLSDARGKLAEQKAELDSKRQESDALEKDIEDLKPRLRASGDEIERIDQEVAEIGKEVKELDGQINKLQDELGEITTSHNRSAIEKLIGESEELRQDIENVEASLKDVQRQILKIETEERLEQTNRAQQQEQLDTVWQEIEEINQQKPQHEARIAELTTAIREIERKVGELSDELQQLRDLKDEIHEKLTAVEVKKTKCEQELIHLEEERQERKIAHFELEQELTSLKQEIEQILSETPDYEPPSAGTVEQLKNQLERLEKRMRALEPVNMKALEEYNQTESRQKELKDNLDTLAMEKEEITQRISGYDELKKRTFLETFEAVNQNFQQIFAELSHGHGRLELENPENPFEGGLIIRAQPRDKKMQRIEALSGGEKSLTALSFVFAFQRYAPAPFYAFDEVDMMLDGFNADRLARMVRRQSDTAQFVVVSLRRPMIENSDHAIGVSLRADGYSRVVGIKEVHIPEHNG